MRQVPLLLLLVIAPLAAQRATPQVTADDYARAERFLAANTAPPGRPRK